MPTVFPSKVDEDALLVNWAQLTITNEKGEVTFRKLICE